MNIGETKELYTVSINSYKDRIDICKWEAKCYAGPDGGAVIAYRCIGYPPDKLSMWTGWKNVGEQYANIPSEVIAFVEDGKTGMSYRGDTACSDTLEGLLTAIKDKVLQMQRVQFDKTREIYESGVLSIKNQLKHLKETYDDRYTVYGKIVARIQSAMTPVEQVPSDELGPLMTPPVTPYQ